MHDPLIAVSAASAAAADDDDDDDDDNDARVVVISNGLSIITRNVHVLSVQHVAVE